MTGKSTRAGKWTAGLLLVLGVAALYVLYHRRNWGLLPPVIEMFRAWWLALRVALGV